MRLLLDTHVFLRLLAELERLGQHLRPIEDPANDPLLSAASSWGIAIKVRLGRLELPDNPKRYVPDRMRAIGAEPLAVEHAAPSRWQSSRCSTGTHSSGCWWRRRVICGSGSSRPTPPSPAMTFRTILV